MDIIRLSNDEGEKLGIRLAKAQDKLRVSGLRWPCLFFSGKAALKWSTELMEKAALAEADGEARIKVTPLRSLTTRNAIRLGFAVRQIYCGGPTYFTQETTGTMLGTLIDVGDNPCPHVALNSSEASASG